VKSDGRGAARFSRIVVYRFSLGQHVPTDHLLRSIDRFVALDGVREHLAAFYSSTGRPSVDPERMIRMLIEGYCYGIRSERRLCQEVGGDGFAVDASLIKADANRQNGVEAQQRLSPEISHRAVHEYLPIALHDENERKSRSCSRISNAFCDLTGGPCGAHGEFLLAAIAQNLRKLAKLIPIRQSAIAA